MRRWTSPFENDNAGLLCGEGYRPPLPAVVASRLGLTRAPAVLTVAIDTCHSCGHFPTCGPCTTYSGGDFSGHGLAITPPTITGGAS